jgi:hypothetical protein
MENADTATIDALVAALYETLSGPAGPRDWDRERRLFAPGAILVSAGPVVRELQRGPAFLDLEGFISSRSPYFALNDFYEKETARKAFRFGNIVHVLSAYEARRHPGDPKPLWRGINSIQLFHDGERWWLVSIVWDNERPDNPMPEWAAGASAA